MATAVSLRSYALAKSLLEAYDAFELRRNGMPIGDIGIKYGLSYEGARCRIRRVESAFKNGTLNEKLRKAKEVIAAYSYEPVRTPVAVVEERLPVRSISGARFSPLY